MRQDVSETAAADLTGRVSVVTGATGGIGQVIATRLARLGSTVVIVCRDGSAGERLRQRIAAQAGADRAEVVAGDLSSRACVREVAAEIAGRHDRLHLLVNNAGAHYRKRLLSADGIEMHVAVDYLAGFGLTLLLLDQLRNGAPSRVVNVVSDAMNDARPVTRHGRPRPVTLDPARLDALREVNGPAGFAPFEAYARAKLLTTMSGYLLASQLRDTGVTVNAVHPGITATGIVDDIIHPLMRPFLGLIKRSLLTPEQGAEPVLRLAIAPELAGVTGRYFVRDAERRSPEISYDRDVQQRVWAASQACVTPGPGHRSPAASGS
ncbi:MAG TPA: SDR family NAD(P)-dependent oxidoreductase [Trebonia sp.]|nr:SDR family NAD(P)-dependent oxidoreductase [Trebonia sp.]